MPRVNAPQPTGLPNLPAPQNIRPPRPASTSQLPNNMQSTGYHNMPGAQAPTIPQAQAPNPFLQNPPLAANANIWQGFGQRQQMFNVPPNFNLPINPNFGVPQFQMPMAGVPMPWMPGQNMLPQHMVNNPPAAMTQAPNANTQPRNEGVNQPLRNPEVAAQQSRPASSQSHDASNTQSGPSSSTSTQNEQTPAGQWRISINQTTFHTGSPMPSLPSAAPPPAQYGTMPYLPHGSRVQMGNLPDSELRTHVQQMRNIANSMTASQRNRAAPSTLAYLLSSPTGPQALLLSPAGSFATAGYPRSAANMPLFGSSQLPLAHNVGHAQPMIHQQHVHQAGQPGPAQPGPGQPPVVNLPPGQLPNQPQLQQQDQVGELLRILLPLGGHLWLLVRLCGFVYLFSSDRGWRNTFLLGLCALVVFAAQTRIFEPLLQYVWTPIRRHVEALVQVDEHAPAATQAQPGAAGTEGREPRSPQDLANRHIQQRRARQNNNPIRAAFTRAERSVALFVASLIPGVGERHVAAREAAARRQREQREREDAARREHEERQRQEQEKAHQPQEHETATEPGTSSSQAEQIQAGQVQGGES